MGGVIVLIAGLTIAAISNNDIWIHIKTGDLILRDLALPRLDPYSFTASDHPYLVHEWLSAVVFSLVYRLAGVPGLTVFKFLLVLGSALSLFFTGRRRGDRLGVVLPAFAVLGYVATQRYIERPHLFTFLFASLYLYLLFRFRDGDRRRWCLAVIVPLHVVWVNLHSGFFLGLVLLAVFAAGALGDWTREKLRGSPREGGLTGTDVALLGGLPLVCLAASLLNPHGVELLMFPFRLTGMEIYMARIFEWRPPFDPVFDSTYMFYGYWVWVVLLVGSFLIPVGRAAATARGWRWVLDAGFIAMFLVFAYAFMWKHEWLTRHRELWILLAGAWCLANLQEMDFTAVGLTTVAFVLSLQHNRHVADALTITFPVLTHNLSRILDWIEGRLLRTSWERRWAVANATAVGVLALALVLLGVQVQVFGYHYTRSGTRQGGIGIAENMPACAVDYVVRRGLSGNAFVSYTTAALLIQRRYPDVKVNMDSRNEVYGPELFEEFERSKQAPSAMAAYLEKYHVDFFLVGYTDLSPPVMHYLLGEAGWAQVFFDDRNVVLVPRKGADPALIARDGYETVFPWLLPSGMIPAGRAEAFLRESTRALAACPAAWLPHWYRAQALIQLKRPNEAIGEILVAVARRPDAWQAWGTLAMLRESAGESAAAAEAYENALKANPSYRNAEVALRRLRGS
jgi:hypothetical protein